MMIVMLLLLLASTASHVVSGSTTHASGVSHQRQPYCIETERQALLTFKQGLVDPDDALQSWTSNNKDCCTWKGIRCDNLTNHITMLHLDPNITYYIDGGFSLSPISGEISASLVQLQYLEYLNLSYNHFTKIPKFIGAFTNLKYLDFSWNYITGNIPSELGNLTNLRILDLSGYFSGLTANSFKWLSHLSYLRIFKLGGTNFSKAKDWFHSFKTAPSLSTLELYDCQFPELDDSSFSHITNSTNSITTLHVYYNNLVDYYTFGSTTVSRLLNLSNNLVDLSLDNYYFNIERSPVPIPDSFDNLKYLRHLYLSGFDGEVPKSIGSLCKLQELVLFGNEFNSTIIDILESLLDCNNSSLEILNLSRNSLIGPLPRDLSRFLHLRELDVSDNKFSGTLPESIGKLTSLQLLYISNNYFIGFVSETHFEKLSKLKHLDLSSNSLTLKTNITWVPPFQLQYINLTSCMIGPQFPSWLQTQSNILRIALPSSGISDVIPEWFFNMTSNLEYLDLSSNLINSTLPNSLLESNNKSPDVDLSSNKFHGCIPPNLLLKASRLDLSNNTLTCFEPLFCDQIDGTTWYLDLSNNQLFGSIPNCLFHLLRNLEYLYLNHNRLSGVIPSSIASLYSIRELRLRKNNLSGTLPSSMKNCTQLSILDVGENSLGGTIPSSLCHLQYIHILDISHNKIYGAIPSCMNSFTSMAKKPEIYFRNYSMRAFETSIIWKGKEYEHIQNLDLFRIIDLSSNKLIGEIPMELTYLVGLNQLNLSRNSLGGVIPQNIGNLSGLESLDLSHNNFSGKIPTGLAELSFLAYLNLSFNHLLGKIPTGTQLQSFSASSYVKNFGLCGLPLLTECPGDHSTSRNHDIKIYNELDQEWFDMSWFFNGLEFGFALGFIGVCGASFLNFYRRLAYFRCLNKFEDWLYVMISVRVSKLKRYFNAK